MEYIEVSDSRFIAAKPTGEEIDFIRECAEMDMDLGDTNDFELRMDYAEWNKDKFWYGNRLFIPGTEYGGIIGEIEVITSTNEIVLGGFTWRGGLLYKIVEPPDGAEHLVLNGDLNDALRELVGKRFDDLYIVSGADTGVSVVNWQVDRYVTLYDAITKLMDAYGYKLQIIYAEPEDLEYGYVELQAVPVVDYSDVLEYSQDGRINFTVHDYRCGINHLVCVGEGQGNERTVLHLYVQEDGSIGKSQYYFGADERAAVYSYTSADAAELEEGGTKRLKELKNYKQVDVTVDDIDLEIGDIIGGYEQITGTSVQKPIIGKIFKISNGKISIEYKVKGDD